MCIRDRRYGTIGKFENKVYPNIVDLLAKCKTEQYTIAVATAKPEHYAKDILDHFELTPYFDAVSYTHLILTV